MNKTFPLPAHQWQDFEQFVGGVNPWIDQHFFLQCYVPRLGQKCEWKSRGYAESVFAILSPPLKLQLQIGRLSLAGGPIGVPRKLAAAALPGGL